MGLPYLCASGWRYRQRLTQMKKLRVTVKIERNEFVTWLEGLGLEDLYGEAITCTLEIDEKIAAILSPNHTSDLVGKQLADLIKIALERLSQRSLGYIKTKALNNPWPLPFEPGDWPEFEEGS